jgi:transketolase
MKAEELKNIANQVRKDILLMASRAKSAHIGGALSCVEVLVILYFKTMKVFPNDPNDDRRDRLIFSKAHDAKALYSVLAERGYFNKKFLKEYECNDGKLPGHSTRHCVPGIEASAGALGHGLSIATGSAYAGKLDNKRFKVFAILSDGECDEGSTWEAALFAGHHKLDNLVAIIDYNKLQGFGTTEEVLNLEPFSNKWKDFGWSVKEVNGNNIKELIEVLGKLPFENNRPSLLIAHTTKGLGGPKEHLGKISSHYKSLSEEEAQTIINKMK